MSPIGETYDTNKLYQYMQPTLRSSPFVLGVHAIAIAVFSVGSLSVLTRRIGWGLFAFVLFACPQTPLGYAQELQQGSENETAATIEQTNERPWKLAEQASQEKRYEDAANLYAAAARDPREMNGTSSFVPTMWFNSARAWNLAGKSDDAWLALHEAMKRGYRKMETLLNDPDLQSLREDQRWREVVESCQKNEDAFLAAIQQPELRTEMLKRMVEDQRVRTQANLDHEEFARVDASNLAFIKQVIAEHGWPGKDLVGEDGANAAWLFVQHSTDHEFQANCLPLVRTAYQNGQNTGPQLALLTDRVLMFQGKPQLYGSQFQLVDGQWKAYPIEEPEHLDRRRAEMGLGPFAEYEAQIRSMSIPKPADSK
jgi:hypothetical protein